MLFYFVFNRYNFSQFKTFWEVAIVINIINIVRNCILFFGKALRHLLLIPSIPGAFIFLRFFIKSATLLTSVLKGSVNEQLSLNYRMLSLTSNSVSGSDKFTEWVWFAWNVFANTSHFSAVVEIRVLFRVRLAICLFFSLKPLINSKKEKNLYQGTSKSFHKLFLCFSISELNSQSLSFCIRKNHLKVYI